MAAMTIKLARRVNISVGRVRIQYYCEILFVAAVWWRAAAATAPWCGALLVCCVHRGLGEL